jgi:hypothetical protein
MQIEIIRGLPADATISLYRCGPMVDLCTGPHLPSTGYLKACGVTNMSRAFWRADVHKEALMRVYAITFPGGWGWGGGLQGGGWGAGCAGAGGGGVGGRLWAWLCVA